jgi:tetratricopeptide (TPR) repeat protein
MQQYARGADQKQRRDIDSLKHLVATSQIDTILAKSMHELGRVYRRVNSDSARWWLQQLISFAEKKHLKKFVPKGLMTTANVYRFDNNLAKSKEYYLKALSEYKKQDDVDGIALANGCIMKCFLLGYGEIDSALFYFNLVIAKKDSLKDQSIVGDAYCDYSSLFIDKGQYHLAIDYLTQAIKIYEEIGRQRFILPAKNTLATIHVLLNNNAKALEIYEDIAPKALKLKSYTLYSSVLFNMGESYKIKKEYAKAEKAYQAGLALNEKYNIVENTDLMYTSLAALKSDMNNPDAAIYFANKALATPNVRKGYSHPAYLQLSNAYIQKKEFALAEKYAQGFLNAQLQKGKKSYLVDAYKNLFTLYTKWGQYEKASAYFMPYSQLKDSLYSAENANKISDLEAWYWSAQKRNELALSKKNEELKTKEVKQARIEKDLYASQRNGLIAATILVIIFGILLYRINLQRRKNKLMQKVTALELKVIRAQMNPHFLFNALSAIQMLINKNDIRQSNTALGKFGKLMRLILENSEKQTIPLEDEITTLELYIELESLRFPFNYSLIIDPLLDKENMQIPSMIIQPYVENAIKHGISNKPTNRNIYIHFKQQESNLFCTVEDDGIGREMAEASKSKYSQHKSMGTKLSKERLELIGKQLSGKASVHIKDLLSEQGHPSGTLVELVIPITYFEN